MKKRLGVIGFGDFSKFFIKHLLPFFDEVIVYSRRDVSIEAQEIGATQKSFEEVCGCEFVMISVVVQYFEETLIKMKPHLKEGACVFDVCSVKEVPIQLMLKYIPENINIIATHSLFGPNSGKDGIKDLNIVLIQVRASDELFFFFDSMFKKMQLQIHYNTAQEHDTDMAYVQVLTHFIAQGIREFGELKKNTFMTTKAYESLLHIEDNLSRDSWLLFESIEKYNKSGRNIREQFLEALQYVDKKLKK